MITWTRVADMLPDRDMPVLVYSAVYGDCMSTMYLASKKQFAVARLGCEDVGITHWSEITMPQDAKNELKPCPFCGAEPEYNDNTSEHYGFDVPGVSCEKCDTRNFAKNKEEAIRKWNARHD
jgi:Lar family restriction alleviation protein